MARDFRKVNSSVNINMRICIIADQIYKSGGIERVLSHRINYWIQKGFEVHLITNENENRKPYFYYHQDMIHHDIDGGFDKNISLFSISNMFLSTKFFSRIRKVINSINPDVVIMPNYSYEYYFIPIIVNGSTYCIKEHHSSYVKTNGLVGRIKNKFSNFYDMHVFLSDEEVRLSSQANSIAIPNPIVPSSFQPKDLIIRQKVILAAGRIVKVKGFERLIESWAKIANSYPEWRLEIYGDGDINYVSSLKKLIRHYGISSNTFIHPSTDKITDKMLDSRIYAMTSLTECFPMVLLEAMQSRMTIIAFDCPTGPRNIIQDKKTGCLVKEGSIKSYSDNLAKIIDDENLAQNLADNAFADIKKYDIETVMIKWNELINNIYKV